jgi:hypothetical protein
MRLGLLLFNQCAHAAVKVNGRIFRDCISVSSSTPQFQTSNLGDRSPTMRLIWKILHQGMRYKSAAQS